MGVTLVAWCPTLQRHGGSDHRFQSLYDPLYPIQVCLATSMVLCTQFYWLDKLSLLLPHTHYTGTTALHKIYYPHNYLFHIKLQLLIFKCSTLL